MRWAALVVLLLAGAWLADRFGSCADRDGPGQRADAILADTTRYIETIARQDSVIATLEDSIRASDLARRHWRDSARALTKVADDAQAGVDAGVAAGVPVGVDPAVFWENAFRAQARVAATLRLQVIPALEATIRADSVGMLQRDEYGWEVRGQRDFARARVNEITREFATYRQATRPGIDLGFVRLPDWADEVALVVLAGYAGCKVGGGC